jgi:hypothetical protein
LWLVEPSAVGSAGLGPELARGFYTIRAEIQSPS